MFNELIVASCNGIGCRVCKQRNQVDLAVVAKTAFGFTWEHVHC